MWTLLEHREVSKRIRKAPRQVHVNYHQWKRIVEMEGPQGLRLIKGFHDEALKGEWFGFRSSRLSKEWGLIYKTEKQQVTVCLNEKDK